MNKEEGIIDPYMGSTFKSVRIIFLIGILIIIGIVIHFVIEEKQIDDYCEEVFPSEIGDTWGITLSVKEGHIECCRYVWEDYKRKSECKIFPYGEGR